MATQQLELGIESYRNGDKLRARAIFTEIVRLNPRDEEAWLWLAACTDIKEQQIYCINRVLSLNPNNVRAQKGLSVIAKSPNADNSTSNTTSTIQPSEQPITDIQPPNGDEVFSLSEIAATLKRSDTLSVTEMNSASAKKTIPPSTTPNKPKTKENATIQLYISKSNAIGIGLILLIVIIGWGLNAQRSQHDEPQQTATSTTAPAGLGLSVDDMVAKYPDYVVTKTDNGTLLTNNTMASDAPISIMLIGSADNLTEVRVGGDLMRNVIGALVMMNVINSVENIWPSGETDIVTFANTDTCSVVQHPYSTVATYKNRTVSLWCKGTYVVASIK